MADFEPAASPSGMPARAAYPRKPSVLSVGGPSEPMQRALDAWYREQPEDFTRSPEAASEINPLDPAERAIALNHLLTYGRLAGEQKLVSLREDADRNGGAVLSPLLSRVEARNAELMARAPAEVHPVLATGLAASTQRLAQKAAAFDTASTGRRKAEALEQSLLLGELLLRQDPEQYETLVADAGAMVEGLGLEDKPRQALGEAVRKRFAGAALQAQADPVAGNPDAAAVDLERGRFRDALDEEEIAAWRELVVANQTRSSAEAARRQQNAGIVDEIRILNRLAAAGRAEAPMPTATEVEAVFPGEGLARIEAARLTLTRLIYQEQRAFQPFDQDAAWVEAGEEGEDRLLRAQVVDDKRKQFNGSGGEAPIPPALRETIDEAVGDFSELGLAIELYQQYLAKLSAPTELIHLLPKDALRTIARQYLNLDNSESKRQWLEGLVEGAGSKWAQALLEALSDNRDGLPPGISALADVLGQPGRQEQVEATITQLDRAQVAAFSRKALAFEGTPDEAERELGKFTSSRSDELAELVQVNPTSPKFRQFVAEAREAEASPHGLDQFAKSYGLHPERLRLVLNIANVDASTPKDEIAELNHRLMVQMPNADADQNEFGMEIVKLEQAEYVSVETQLRVVHKLLPFATIRDPRDSEIDEQVVDAATGMSHAIGPFVPTTIARSGGGGRWVPQKPASEAEPISAQRRASNATPSKPADVDPDLEARRKIEALDGEDVTRIQDPAVVRAYAEFDRLRNEWPSLRSLPGWLRRLGPHNQRIGAAHEVLMNAVARAKGIAAVAGTGRPTGGPGSYIPDSVILNRLGAESAIADAKYSRSGRWKWRPSQIDGMEYDRRRGLSTYGWGIEGTGTRITVREMTRPRNRTGARPPS